MPDQVAPYETRRYPVPLCATQETIRLGPFAIFFSNVNVAMGLRGHSHTGSVEVVYDTLGVHGYPSFQATNDALRARLRELTDKTFRDATNEDVARRLFADLDGWRDGSWTQWGGNYQLRALTLHVEGVHDKIGHDEGVTSYRIERANPTPALTHAPDGRVLVDPGLLGYGIADVFHRQEDPQ